MYCAQCGTELSDGAKFCVNCGTPVPSQKENTVKAVAKQVQPKTNWFPKETVGEFYHHFLMMLSNETQDYFDRARPGACTHRPGAWLSTFSVNQDAPY